MTGATRAELQQALDNATRGRALPTTSVVSGLLPGGVLRAGAVYSVVGSTALSMAMMAGPSAEGGWCAVVGLPEFGAEAAAGLGVDLDRLVLVATPQREWLNVVAALVDALTVVVVQPPGPVAAAEAARLSARMRKHGSALIVIGPRAATWPAVEARLQVGESTWSGVGVGFGCLTARQVSVTVTGRGTAARPRVHQLWLPGPDGTAQPVVSPVARVVAPGPDAPAWQHEAVG